MSAHTFSLSPSALAARQPPRGGLLWFGAACVLAGAAFSTFLWRRRLRVVEAVISPLERAEEMIANCERKLDTIEKSVADIKDIQSDIQASQVSAPTGTAASGQENGTGADSRARNN